MTWSDVTREPKPKVIRQFGGICAALLLVVGLVQVFAKGRLPLGWGLVTLAVVCLAVALVAPRQFRWVYTGAMLVAFPIGFVVSQVMLGFLFFVVFLAIGLLLRVRGWDAMLRRRKASGESYWQAKPIPADARRYLRQY